MRIHYRVIGEQIEIIRCFGADPQIVLPERIEGLPVVRTAAYAFSDRKGAEEEDVRIFETEGHRMFGDSGSLLAGGTVQSVSFPDTMEKIGRYVFYGCRNLRELSFSDRLADIGSGAFTGCRSLCRLKVNLTDGEKTCVKEILGELWQRIDVTLLREGEEARLVFPEHYEEAVENTPARILFTQHHGSGNNYRQCFYNREADYRKYDALFYLAKAQDKTEVLTDLAFSRLMYPVGLTVDAEAEYESYVRAHQREVLEYLTDREEMPMLREMAKRDLWERGALDAAIDHAARKGRREVLSFLMDEKHRCFPVKRKRYEL